MGTHDDHISFFFQCLTLLNYHILKYGVPIKISCRTNVFIGCGNILSLYVIYGTVSLGLRFTIIFFQGLKRVTVSHMVKNSVPVKYLVTPMFLLGAVIYYRCMSNIEPFR